LPPAGDEVLLQALRSFRRAPLHDGAAALCCDLGAQRPPNPRGRGGRALMVAAFWLLCLPLPLAHTAVDPKMYTRLACPTVQHRWLAASQYLTSTSWLDGVQTGAQDAVLVNSDTGMPAISKPYYDVGTQSVLFSPRTNAATTGPYVNLQSVHFGTGDFTFVILAKYKAPGSQGDVWPRIFDFSSTGTPQGTYFILTEVRTASAPPRKGRPCTIRECCAYACNASRTPRSTAVRTWCTLP
jgi:hypothetical protein